MGIKKVRELIAVSKDSIGVSYGLKSAMFRLYQLIEELELTEKQLQNTELRMEKELNLRREFAFYLKTIT